MGGQIRDIIMLCILVLLCLKYLLILRELIRGYRSRKKRHDSAVKIVRKLIEDHKRKEREYARSQEQREQVAEMRYALRPDKLSGTLGDVSSIFSELTADEEEE